MCELTSLEQREPFHSAMIAIHSWQASHGGCPWSRCSYLQWHGKGATTCPLDTVFLSNGFGKLCVSRKKQSWPNDHSLPLCFFQWNPAATPIQPSLLTVSKHSSIGGSCLLDTMRHPLTIQVALSSPAQITYLVGTSMVLGLSQLHVQRLRLHAAELILGSLSISSRIVCRGIRQIGAAGRMWSWVPFLFPGLCISPPPNSKLLCDLQTLKPRRVNLTWQSM